jgi:hypothetical protein
MGGLPKNAREGISRQSQRQEILDHSQACRCHEMKDVASSGAVKDCGQTAAAAQADIPQAPARTHMFLAIHPKNSPV